MDNFDWNNDPDVVVQPRIAIAVYPNSKGHIVVRAMRWDDDEDQFVSFPKQDAEAIIAAIRSVASEKEPPACENSAG